MFNLEKLSLLLATGFIQYSLGIQFDNPSTRPVIFCLLDQEEHEVASFVLQPGERMQLTLHENPSSIDAAHTVRAVAQSPSLIDPDQELFHMARPSSDVSVVSVPADS
jgi:hypothetical protein